MLSTFWLKIFFTVKHRHFTLIYKHFFKVQWISPPKIPIIWFKMVLKYIEAHIGRWVNNLTAYFININNKHLRWLGLNLLQGFVKVCHLQFWPFCRFCFVQEANTWTQKRALGPLFVPPSPTKLGNPPNRQGWAPPTVSVRHFIPSSPQPNPLSTLKAQEITVWKDRR